MLRFAMAASTALLLASSAASASPSGKELSGFRAHGVPLGREGSFLPSVPAGLYPLNAQFGQLPSDYNGTDQWPCYGGAANCSSIDQNGVVLGIPVYAWSLSACNNNTAPATPC